MTSWYNQRKWMHSCSLCVIRCEVWTAINTLTHWHCGFNHCITSENAWMDVHCFEMCEVWTAISNNDRFNNVCVIITKKKNGLIYNRGVGRSGSKGAPVYASVQSRIIFWTRETLMSCLRENHAEVFGWPARIFMKFSPNTLQID